MGTLNFNVKLVFFFKMYVITKIKTCKPQSTILLAYETRIELSMEPMAAPRCRCEHGSQRCHVKLNGKNPGNLNKDNY